MPHPDPQIQKLLTALKQNETYQQCPKAVQEKVHTLVQALAERDWDDWDSQAEFKFTEALLMEVFGLPEDLADL